MSEMKLAFYSLTSCEGCLTTLITKLGPDVEGLWNNFDIDYFKLVREPVGGSKFPKADIAFVEGAVVTNLDREHLLEIRKNSRFIVAMGTCASTGNIAYTASRSVKLGKRALSVLEVYEAEPLSSVIAVDFEINGCPVNADEFTEALLRLVNGLEPIQPDFSVCYQCKLAGNVCLLERGQPCLGPVAMGGCGAACTSVGSPCLGCRGPFLEADVEAYFKTLEKRGVGVEQIKPLLHMFMGKKIKEVLRNE